MSKEKRLTPHDITTYLDNQKKRELSLKDQCDLLGISRSSAYYQPVPVLQEDISLMNRIDKIHTDFPFYGARKIAPALTSEVGFTVGRKRAGTLMERMGIEALYPKPRLSQNNKPHPVFPYLLKGVTIEKPNQVWSADITYIKMRKGFLYLVVFMDWYSRYILSWELSDNLRSEFCLKAADKALKINVPGIINFDQGKQFTDLEMIDLWQNYKTQISMDHRGRCFDNIFTERFWRSLKYEEVYLKDYTCFQEARESIGAYIEKYDNVRLHQALSYKTPKEVYFTS